ncbi:MAG: hypothetical protein LBU46_00590 [Candidatus Accumulibacter sp.]|jgi:hypothetical protein|nr:hypothetical protein [Accumulibacter sp.]
MPSVVFVFKLTLVPLLIAGITLAGRRWGAAIAGCLSGMPVVAGPIMFFMAIEQGTVFASQAVVGMLLGVLATLGFNLAYAWASTRLSWQGSLLAALVIYFFAVAGLNETALSLNVSGVLVFVCLLAAARLFPSVQVRAATATASPQWDIPIRMTAGAMLVLAVTYGAAKCGAHLSGLFATFPVISMVLAVFSHRQSGHEFAIRLLHGIVFGWFAFVLFCLVLGWTLPLLGIAGAFMLAILAAAITQISSMRLMQVLRRK